MTAQDPAQPTPGAPAQAKIASEAVNAALDALARAGNLQAALASLAPRRADVLAIRATAEARGDRLLVLRADDVLATMDLTELMLRNRAGR